MQKRVKDLLPLVDADIIGHESCYAGQITEDDGSISILPFHLVASKIDSKILEIMATLDTSLEPIMFLSGATNFRDDVAKRKGYKANRTGEKPFHFLNAKAYITARYNTYTSVGCEADDLMCIYQTDVLKRVKFDQARATTVICSRDKDLRQCRGWFYSWECGQQPEYPLTWIEELGSLDATYQEGVSPKTGKPFKKFKKLTGTGYVWFCAQALTGDTVDNIGGLPRYGAAKAYDLLKDAPSKREAFHIVVQSYKEVYTDTWKPELLEQCQLVWLIDSRNQDGSLHHFAIEEHYIDS